MKVGYWSTCGREGAVCGTLLITPLLPLEGFGGSQQLREACAHILTEGTIIVSDGRANSVASGRSAGGEA